MNYGQALTAVMLGLALAAAHACAPPRREVVIYVAVDRKDAEPLLRAFEQQSGMLVRAVYDAEAAKTTGLVTRLVAESRRPRCDVFWNNEFVQTMQLADRGLLDTYPSPAATDIPDAYKDPQGRWCGQAARARVIVYNTRLVAPEEVPRGLRDLTKPQWRGKLAVADPQFGTTRTHAAALFAVLGPEAATQWWREILENQPRIVAGNALVKNLVARADAHASPILVGLTDTDDVRAGQAEGAPIDMVFPDQDGIGTLIVPTTVSVIRDGPHPEAARELVDYLLGPDVERQLTAEGTGYHSLRKDAAGRSGWEVKPLEASYNQVYEQLETSTQWTAEHFRP